MHGAMALLGGFSIVKRSVLSKNRILSPYVCNQEDQTMPRLYKIGYCCNKLNCYVINIQDIYHLSYILANSILKTQSLSHSPIIYKQFLCTYLYTAPGYGNII